MTLELILVFQGQRSESKLEWSVENVAFFVELYFILQGSHFD